MARAWTRTHALAVLLAFAATVIWPNPDLGIGLSGLFLAAVIGGTAILTFLITSLDEYKFQESRLIAIRYLAAISVWVAVAAPVLYAVLKVSGVGVTSEFFDPMMGAIAGSSWGAAVQFRVLQERLRQRDAV